MFSTCFHLYFSPLHLSSSYAPSYDSAFSNISKEESDLVYQTYGSESSVQYAESIQDFVKDSDYASQLIDSLLDLLTGGEHSKTKKILEENKNLREEEVAVKTMLEVKPIDAVKVKMEDLRSLQGKKATFNFYLFFNFLNFICYF